MNPTPKGSDVLPRLARFEVLREIGRGGAGIVYAAVERESGRRVALKTLRAMNGELLLQLKAEFRALQDLEHPNLIRLEHLMREGDTWFFTMEIVNGVSIAAYVTGGAPWLSPSTGRSDPDRGERSDRGGQGATEPARFDEGKLRDALAQLARGLGALHAAGKVHRDVKPANVLVTMEGRVVILDLGLVREITASSEESVTGTALYMAPEQVTGESVDPACDWYAVGVILYLCLTGRHPFEGPMDEVMTRKVAADPPPPSSLAQGIPEDLNALCVELLQRDPRSRPGAEDVVRRLHGSSPGGRPHRPNAHAGPRPFVGRVSQFQALAEAFADLRAGQPITVVVEGESGVGKSALVRRFTRTLPTFYAGVLVFVGRCHEREDLPYKALDGIVDAVSEYLATLPSEVARALLPGGMELLSQVFPVLQRAGGVGDARPSAPPVGLGPLGMQEGRARLFASLRDLFARLAAHRHLVLVIEDIQWADGDSLALLASMLHPPGAPPLLLLTTARTVAGEGVMLGLPGDVRSVVVGRLTPEEGTELAGALLESAGRADPLAVASLAAEAGGHPLFLEELVRHARLEGDQSQAKISLDRMFATRLTGLEPGPRRLLEILAVAGIGLRQETAMLASGTSVREYGAFAQTLRAGRLARTTRRGGEEVIETYHELVREAVAAHLGEDALRRDHQAIARALEAAPELDPDALATHWLAAGDAARGRAFLLKAAEKAYLSLAFDRAARLYRRALADMEADAPGRQAARVRLADCFAHAGRGVEAARAFGEAADHAREQEALELRRLQAEHLLNAGCFEEGEAVMDQVLAAVGLRIPKSSLAAIVLFVATRTRLWFRGRGSKERREGEIPSHELTRLDACAQVASLLGMFHALRAIGLQTRGLLFALEAGEPVRLSRALAVDAAFLSTAGPRAAPKWAAAMARAIEIAERIGTPHARGVVLGAEALIDHMVGDWPSAREKAPRAVEMLVQDSMGAVWDVRTARMVLLWSLTWTGQLGELQRELDEYLRNADARGDLYAATSMAAGPAGALAWLCGDDPAFARETVRRAAERWTHRQYGNQDYWSFFAASHADLYEGKGEAVWEGLLGHWPRMKRALVLEVQIIRLEALFFRARVALVTAAERPHLGAKMLRAAASSARAIRREDAPYSAPMADLILASIEATNGRGAEAIALLRGALAGFDARGMELYRESARWRLGQQTGGEEGRSLVATAEQWASRQGVRNPPRMLALMAPGFARSLARTLTRLLPTTTPPPTTGP